jgi:uncharacterized protein YgbK (DUF1537 family)
LDLLILADDFTGAGDAAAPFAAGRRVLVVLSAAEASRPRWDADDVDVLAVDLDLRECLDAPAQRTTETVARHLCATSGKLSAAARVFLKIDSTLRGPIAGLVAGALTGSGKDVAVIAPAFPEQGRLLHEGTVVVDGQRGASLMSLLGMPGTALVGAKFADSAAVERAVAHARMRGAQRVVVDADSAVCLQHVAAAWRRHPDWLLVGSGGLARQVAGPVLAAPTIELTPAAGPVLVIAGSPTAMTAAQIDRLRDLGSITTLSTTMSAPTPACPAPADGLLVLCTSPASERDAGESASAIADTVAEWSRSIRPAAVVLAGGATARRVCARLGAVGVRLSGELSPGIPIGHLVGGRWDQVLVVTKAGGFGNPATLLDVVRSVGVSSRLP